ncbi:hypothetical protein M436DRAFT_65044 [Aureobasidium namibiae CBS 147.97]|uniref:F-box domain-containing protein n=1 Tax=Aureobasidium namibiae CBS 147.97 TaxID=1043004 RepID=A0A074WGQ9_9PEZI|nr:uncharacterized protein M436DRAFT_65044 [Aureobasidium namibiae CBS 147.97]KEQ72280.1 hypothetical protein M436DRAFT_65044 [Aureobasidium namibiae CBS 147.97]
MDRLPTEVLQNICRFLSRHELVQFSLINKICWAASRPRFFHTVCVNFSSPQTLEATVERWTAVLQSSDSFAAVEHLQVVAKDLYSLSLSQRLENCGDHPLDPWRFCAIDDRSTRQLEHHAQWQKLEQLLKRLRGLRDLTWGCREQIPPCVLRYIHDRLPQCRLHMRNFSLRNLIQPPQVPIDIDPHELEIARSPCLYSIAMKYDYMYSDCANYNEDAVREMVASVAPSLKEVSLLYESSGCDPWLVAALRVPRQSWHRALISPLSLNTARGALNCLELATRITIDSLSVWSKLTDFSALRSLKLHHSIVPSELRWLTDHCRFDSLDTLIIKPDLAVEDNVEGLADATEDFLHALPPLRKLKLTGTYQQRTVISAIDHSGAFLQRLHLALTDDQSGSVPEPSSSGLASPDFSHTLQQRCPVLEDVSLCILRTQGDAHEVAIYRGLGKIPTLRKIHLSIYCSQSLSGDEEILRGVSLANSSASSDIEGRLSEVDKVLIDFAIDDTLAKSVFRTISAAKPAYATPLECLTLRVEAFGADGGWGSRHDLIKLLQYIGHSWTCTGTLRDDRPHECVLEEYDQEDQLDRNYMEESGELAKITNAQIIAALHRVWPESRNANWKDKWHSFPLDTTHTL